MVARRERKRPSYTDAFRATAVAALIADGYPEREGALSKVAKAFNLHARTLQRWADDVQSAPPDDLVTQKKAGMADLIEKEIYEVLDLMPEKRERANYSQLAIVLGVLIDKMRLLRDLPTEIVHVLPEFLAAAQRRNIDPMEIMRETINALDSEAKV